MTETTSIKEETIYELGIETTKLLNDSQDKLEQINWTNGEANIDTEYSKVACDCCIIAWNNIKHKYPDYTETIIICEIPDINITFTYPDKRTSKHKIELKSSKSEKMSGSTIKSLDINQTLIYCLRPSNNSKPYQLKCSQYHSAMGYRDIDLFQDRTPRPTINFGKMNDTPFESKSKNCWIEHYAKCGIKRIDENTVCDKSWQDDMIRIMKKFILDEYIKNTTEAQFQIDKISSQIENTTI